MRTLILFASKHGCTRTAAKQLASQLPTVEVLDIAEQSHPDLSAFDNVIIGSSVYVGQINKDLAQFLAKNIALLKQKRIGLFICCGLTEKAGEQLESAFPAELVQAAVVKGYFGYDFTHLTLAEKLLCKAIGAPIGKSEIRNADIARFAEAFTNQA